MGVWKLNPHDLSSLRRTPKELSLFWRTYFSNISIGFSKTYFKQFRTNVPVHLVSRDIVKAKDYFKDLKPNSILRPFQILPHGELGFIHIPQDLANFLINLILGGQQEYGDEAHELTSTDAELLGQLILDKLEVLQTQFLDDDRHIEIALVEEHDILLYANSFHSEQLVSLQQFSVEFGSHAYIFTIGIGNRLLEQFIQL